MFKREWKLSKKWTITLDLAHWGLVVGLQASFSDGFRWGVDLNIGPLYLDKEF